MSHAGTGAEPRPDPALVEQRARTYAALCVGSFWVVPVLGPLVLRPFMGGHPFAMYYFRLALVIQSAFVVGMGSSYVESRLSGESGSWGAVLTLALLVWTVYGSFLCLTAALRGERRGLRPIPESWVESRHDVAVPSA